MLSRLVFAVLFVAALAPSLRAQEADLYNETVLRTIDITLPGTNFWSQLLQTVNSGNNLVADLTLSGPDLATPISITGVGIRIKGNSSFFFLPSGSRKTSFNIEITETDSSARLLGYRTLNLNNGIEDPTFCREITFFRFIRRYTPAGLGNHVLLRINGEAWGVYVNVQQYNSDLLEEFFAEESGARYKAKNVGTAQDALRYVGTNPASYASRYQLKDDGGLALPWQPMIDGTFALNNSGTNAAAIDEDLSIDSAIWALVAENLFMDEDSYIAKGADFNVYADPLHGQIHLHQHDGNESWGVSYFGWPGGATTTLSPTHNFNSSSKPALSRIMSIPAQRERYFAHMRTMLADFSWGDLSPQLLGYKALIDAEVQADTKKIYSYSQFQSNFNTQTTINIGGSNVPVPGLEQFLNSRQAYLLAHADINEIAPTISELGHSVQSPAVGTPVFVTARMTVAGSTIDHATLYYREIGRFLSTPMFDDGQHGDGAAGDDIYGAQIPVPGTAGARLDYYVEAGVPSGVGGGLKFEPKYAEGHPAFLYYPFGGMGIRITEFMYAGNGDEFIELTNTSSAPISLSGWSFDDGSGMPGGFDLSGAGTVNPGQSIVVTAGPAAGFALDWGLVGVTVLEGNVNAQIGRNDGLFVFDGQGVVQDRLMYGDEDYPGSVRAREASTWVCTDGLGGDDIYYWVSSMEGDLQGSIESVGGDIGSPGQWASAPCGGLGTPYCLSAVNSTGLISEIRADGSRDVATNDVTLTAASLPPNSTGFFLVSAEQGSVANPGGSVGTLCLGTSIGRYVGQGQIGNSGAAGTISLVIDLGALPQPSGVAAVAAGETWNWQLWHRDSVGGQAVSNFTHGLGITFE